jgi:hypothetical protein
MKISAKAVYKLTLLWAFAESGLGGLLHGLHVPITGFVLGAFSVVIISLIARYSPNPARDILTSTLLVMAVKFSASPHSPLPAYLALLFQGCAGALLFKVFKCNAITLTAFSILAMVESAIQKPLLATIIFGKELWLAIDEYVNKLISVFSDYTVENFSVYFLLIYTLIYALWGFAVGVWAHKLPAKLATFSITPESPDSNTASIVIEKRKRWFFISIFLVVLLLLALYVVEMPAPLLYIIRTLLIIAFIYVVITPLLKYFLKRFSRQRYSFVNEFYGALPELKNTIQQANRFAAAHKGLYKRWSTFLLCLLYLNLQDEAG